MNLELNDLAVVLEEEIALGDKLRLNLAEQRHALAAWDMDALIARIEAREAWIRTLGELEARRARIVEIQGDSDKPVSLSELIRDCPEDLPARQRLQSVRARARETFLRLQADERDLNLLMETLLSHFHVALKPLASSSLAVYGESITGHRISAHL
jgi:FlgN protein